MKSTFHPVPNLRGRKSYNFSCGCCSAFDKRDDYFRCLDEAEMRDAKRGETEKGIDSEQS